MSTIQDDPPAPAPASPPARRRALAAWWPLLLLGALCVAIAARAAGDDAAARGGGNDAPVLRTRSFGGIELELPASWVTLERTGEHVTWGEPSRAHTVTVAATELGAASLPAVVDAAAAQVEHELPGIRTDGEPRTVELEHAPRADSALLASFRAGELHVVQAWRRDTRAGQDLVATWTSADGHWPVQPRDAIPRAAASG